ncbi:MAG: hypothetical protein JST42_02325 [Bacteroidetes bacterium]|nr:hypothetical protein [Bacteroidota bacterium]
MSVSWDTATAFVSRLTSCCRLIFSIDDGCSKKNPTFVPVNKAIAILLMSIYLFGTTEAYQALKLPLLVQHYIKHKNENPRLTLLGFLKIHYSDKSVVDADYQQDQRLPFKTQENTSLFSAVNDIPQPMVITVESPLSAPPDYFLLDTRVDFSTFPHSIFQPPRA